MILSSIAKYKLKIPQNMPTYVKLQLTLIAIKISIKALLIKLLLKNKNVIYLSTLLLINYKRLKIHQSDNCFTAT